MNLSWMIVFTTAVPALIPILWGVWFMRRARRSLTWPAVQATIQESRVLQQGSARSPRLAFAYAVAGQPHVGTRLWVGPRSIAVTGNWADRVVARYPVGAAARGGRGSGRPGLRRAGAGPAGHPPAAAGHRPVHLRGGHLRRHRGDVTPARIKCVHA